MYFRLCKTYYSHRDAQFSHHSEMQDSAVLNPVTSDVMFYGYLND